MLRHYQDNFKERTLKQLQNFVYLGGVQAVTSVEVGTFEVDGQRLGPSVSANVARRYGEVVTRLVVNDVPTKVIALQDLRNGYPSLADIRKEGFSAVRVTGDLQDFDVPVGLVIALDESALSVHSVVSAAELMVCQPGLPQVHQPQGPSSIGWDAMVVSSGLGNKALEVRGWVLFDDGVYRGSVAADDYWREYLVCAIPVTGGWLIQSNYSDSEAFVKTREDALRTADWWRRHEMRRRREHFATKDTPYPEVFDEDCFPF